MDKNYAVDIIRDAGFGFLATIEGEKPKVRPYMPYFMEDDNELLISVFPNRRSIAQIEKNSNIEACFVDRKMQFCRLSGEANMHDDLKKKEILWENVPMLRQFYSGPEDENFKLIVAKITSIEIMTPSQQEPTIINL